MTGAGGRRRWHGRSTARRGGAEASGKGERWPSGGLGDGALGTGPKLFGPVEGLVICTRADASTHATHGLSGTKAHATSKRGGGSGADAVIVLDGTLVDRVRVGRETGTAQERNGGSGRRARQTKGRDGEPPALVIEGRRREGRGEGRDGGLRDGIASEEVAERRRGHRPASLLP